MPASTASCKLIASCSSLVTKSLVSSKKPASPDPNVIPAVFVIGSYSVIVSPPAALATVFKFSFNASSL